MTRYDLLKMNTSVLRIFINNKIDLKDVEHLCIFEEYTDLRNQGYKFVYVVNYLSQKYKKSPRSISQIAQRMRADVVLG